jgi:hypothetical protein
MLLLLLFSGNQMLLEAGFVLVCSDTSSVDATSLYPSAIVRCCCKMVAVFLSTETAGVITRVNGPSHWSLTSMKSLYNDCEDLTTLLPTVALESSY